MKFCKTLILAFFLSAICVVHAEWVDESTVKTAAEAFTSNDAIGSTILKGCAVSGLVQRQHLWIVSLEPSGHIVMRGSDLADPIVGFSMNNFAEPSPDSPAYAVLESASASLAALEAQGGTRHARWTNLLGPVGRPLLKAGAVESPGTILIPPLMESHWNQWQPYNDYSPVYIAETNEIDHLKYRGRTPCGCVATAAAQILRHFRWPARIDRVDSYSHNFTDTNEVTTTYPIRFDGHLPIDWAALNDDYQVSESDLRGTVGESTRYPIARLVMFADVLAQMSFAGYGSAASFDTVEKNTSEWYTQGELVDMSNRVEQIKAEIMAGVPCAISIAEYDDKGQRQGHLAVAHGWAESGSTKYVYINFGWGGANDGYYNLEDDITIEKPKEEFTEKKAYLGFYPRAKPQLDPLPKVCETSTTLNWHFPDIYTNNLSGFTVSISRRDTTPSTFRDDFSDSLGSSSSNEIYVDKENGLLYSEYSARGNFTYAQSFVLTSASELSFKVSSYAAISSTLEIQVRFNGGDWQTVSTPALNEKMIGSSGWNTFSIYLGEHGGDTAQFRIVRDWGGTYYIDENKNRVDYGRVRLKDFTVTNVLAPVAPEVRNVDKSERSITLSGLEEGAYYSFVVTPDISGALVDGEASEPESTIIAGYRSTPIPGEQTYTTSVPAIAWKEETLIAQGFPEIDSVTHSKSEVVDGLFAECSMGGNVFHVNCSPSTVSLAAHVSVASLVPDSAIEIHKLGNGRFAVEVDASGIPASAERTRAILTLAATDSNGTTSYKDLSLRFSTETTPDDYVPIPVVVIINPDRMDEPIESNCGTRTIAAKENVTLSQADADAITISAHMQDGSEDADTTSGYSKVYDEASNTIVITLNAPVVAPPTAEGDKEDGDASGILLDKNTVTLATTDPTPTQEDVAALPVESVKGLWYQASWGDGLTGMDSGEKVQATGDSLYLGVIKQTGGKGFYKITVSEE